MTSRLLSPLVFAAGLVLGGLGVGAQGAPEPGAGGPVAAVRARLGGAMLAGSRWPDFNDVAADVQRAYERVSWAPLWSNGGRPTTAAAGVVRFLAAVDSLGLQPADYDVPLLDSVLTAAVAAPLDEETLARFEATLSVATARALSALRWGRVRQPRAYPTLRRSRSDYDLGAGVFAVSRTADPGPVFDQAAPQWAPYRQLVAALPAARRDAADSLLIPVAGPPVTRSGSPFRAAPRLRALLALSGAHADSGAPPVGADTLLDASLTRALRAFQKQQRLRVTGAFDAATRDRLRGLLQERVRSAVLTLERWRWLPRTGDQRAIIVNVPEFRLHVYDTIAGLRPPAFTMKVVVGKGEEDRYTPMFVDEVEHLVFSPFWEVPKAIALEEIVPKVRSDASYLARNRYVLVRGYSDSAPVIAADTAAMARIGQSVRVRQLPGDYNSLGRVKFMLPNHLNIYLHDTNEKHLFRREVRAFSHGCIRVSEPRRLAEWLLQTDTAWTVDRMRKAMKSDTPERVPLGDHVPVFIVYHTASVDEHGVLRSYPDVYRHDKELADLLAQGIPYAR
jgi:murein L,D-transpeptidase YcbB/YkuD